MTPEQKVIRREYMIEELLRDAFTPEYGRGERMSQTAKIERALGWIKDTALVRELRGDDGKTPTADFYLAACPIPPFIRPMKTGKDFANNVLRAAWAYSQLPYWRGTECLKITKDEVEASDAFRVMKDKYIWRGVDLSVDGVNEHYVGSNDIKVRVTKLVCVRLNAEMR